MLNWIYYQTESVARNYGCLNYTSLIKVVLRRIFAHSKIIEIKTKIKISIMIYVNRPTDIEQYSRRLINIVFINTAFTNYIHPPNLVNNLCVGFSLSRNITSGFIYLLKIYTVFILNLYIYIMLDYQLGGNYIYKV